MRKVLNTVLFIALVINLYSQSFRKAPYLLYPGHNNQMLIVWQLSATDSCILSYGTDITYSDSTIVTKEADISHRHIILLDSLVPGTKYYYKVKCGTTYKYGNFYTGPADSVDKVSFYAYGDTRTYPDAHDKVAARILSSISQDPQSQTLVLVSGDLVSDGDNETDWDNEFFNPQYTNIQKLLATLPYLATMGNHEEQGILFKKYFPYPMYRGNCYYSFNYGPMHITVIDQYTDYGVGSLQYNWLVNDLSTSTKKWKIIMLHEPGWSAGGHSNNLEVQQLIQPLCEKYGVQMVIAGHNHYYARAMVNGVAHITTGGGGAPLYGCFSNAENIVKCESVHHFCKLEINEDTLTFSAIRDNGTVIETFKMPSVATGVNDDGTTGISVRAINNTVYVEAGEPIKSVEAFNVTGQKVFTGNFNSAKVSFTLPGPEIYFLIIRTNQGHHARKILVLKN